MSTAVYFPDISQSEPVKDTVSLLRALLCFLPCLLSLPNPTICLVGPCGLPPQCLVDFSSHWCPALFLFPTYWPPYSSLKLACHTPASTPLHLLFLLLAVISHPPPPRGLSFLCLDPFTEPFPGSVQYEMDHVYGLSLAPYPALVFFMVVLTILTDLSCWFLLLIHLPLSFPPFPSSSSSSSFPTKHY